LRIAILAIGSRGDVLPYALLGRALVQRGHRVCLAALENEAPLAAAYGLAFHPLPGDGREIMGTQGGVALAESGRSVLRAWRAIMRSFGAAARSYTRALSALGPTDAILTQLPGALFAVDLAEERGLSLLMAAVMPLTRTRAFPMMAFPSPSIPVPLYNMLTYRIAEQLLWQAFRHTVNRWRRQELGLAPWPLHGYYRQLESRGVPVLNGFSAHVVARPPDWGEHVHITGYWLPGEEAWEPPSALLRFLEAGPPPLFVGFGSMPLRDPQRVTDIVLEALHLTGQRALLGAGWGGLRGHNLPETVLQVDYVPYSWLFPRVAAVVHHGGSGTTGMGLRAGVPSVVVPFVFDQFFWGRRIAELGVGPLPVPYRQLSAERLATAIDASVSDAPMRERAEVLGAQIQKEDGIANAVRLIERYLDQPS
jgi:UDP:flavonoid glycosyltransferase YjiC (YdhE family)